MKRVVVLLVLIAFAVPALASTHHEQYKLTCPQLWMGVKDTLKNSGKYGIIGIDNQEMTATYNMGGNLTGKRTNSVVLTSKDGGCDLQVQTAFSGLANNDFGDFKKRVDESIDKLTKSGELNNAAAPAAGGAPAAPAQAQISVTSTPTGADIEIDGNFVGSAPSTVQLPPGDHTVKVTKKGYEAWEKKVRVTGGTINLNAELDAVK